MATTGSPNPDLDDDNQVWVSLLVICTVLSLATVVVGLRFYTRIFLLKQLGLDDWITALALMFAIAAGGSVLANIPNGLGRHIWTLPPALLPLYMMTLYVSIALYNATLMIIKLAFLCQYYRVFAVHKMKTVIWIVGGVVMCWAVSQVLIAVFTCTPIHRFWDMTIDGTCVPNQPFWYINAAGNIITDVTILLLPLPALAKLQLRKQQKYMLMGIFSLGLFTCAISLIRLKYLTQGPDFTFTNTGTSGWSISELSCGIICACLPTLRPLMIKLKPAWMISYGRSHLSRSGRKRATTMADGAGGTGTGGNRGTARLSAATKEPMTVSTFDRSHHQRASRSRSSQDPINFPDYRDFAYNGKLDVEMGFMELAMPKMPSPMFKSTNQYATDNRHMEHRERRDSGLDTDNRHMERRRDSDTDTDCSSMFAVAVQDPTSPETSQHHVASFRSKSQLSYHVSYDEPGREAAGGSGVLGSHTEVMVGGKQARDKSKTLGGGIEISRAVTVTTSAS